MTGFEVVEPLVAMDVKKKGVDAAECESKPLFDSHFLVMKRRGIVFF